MIRPLAALLLLGAAPVPAPVDVLIGGGTIYPGGGAPFTGDVAVRGDRIVAVGTHLTLRAVRTIDATGMIVAPGFIDPHAHVGDMLTGDDARTRLVLPFLMQGVTTSFIGNDGGGDPRVGKLLGSVATRPVGINYAAYVGFGAVRRQVIVMARRAPAPHELARMRGIVARAMCEGAPGLSTGLFYAPQSFAATDEVVAIGRRADVPVQISHIRALGVDVAGQAPAIVAKIAAARAAGQRVTADQYPWDASGTSLVAALVPLWAQDGGRQALLARFADPALAARLHADMAENLRRRGGADKLLITEGPQKDRTLAALAAGGDPITAAVAVIRIADPAVASFNQRADDIAAFMAQPWVMTGSDASPGHPRVYGSFARKYAKYVRADHVLTLRAFVDRSATLAADTFGLKDRGRIAAGRALPHVPAGGCR